MLNIEDLSGRIIDFGGRDIYEDENEKYIN